jgi:hypothetical protein
LTAWQALFDLGRLERGQRVIVGAITPLAEGKTAFETKRRGGKRGKAVLHVAAP